MKKLIYFSLFVFNFSLCSAQSWDWGVQGNNIDINAVEEGLATSRDNNGNLFLTGFLYGEMILGTDTINSVNPSYSCAYLVKYDSNGNIKWAKQSVGINHQQLARCVATDNVGNSYVTGHFVDTVHFGALTLISPSLSSFVVKYDPLGNVKWARQSVNYRTNYADAFGVAIDYMGNVYITGSQYDTTLFGTDTLLGHNFFLIKYDSTGNLLWATTAKGPKGSESLAYAIVADAAGNTYLTGELYDTTFFGRDTINTTGTGFIAKYNSAGHPVWAVPGGSRGYAICIDSAENVYSTGFYVSSTVIGNVTLPPPSNANNLYLDKYDSAGKFKWVRYPNNITTTNFPIGYCVTADKYCNIYLLGGIGNGFVSVDFGSLNLTINDAYNSAALVKYDSTGNALCGTMIASAGDDQSGLVADPSGNAVYFGGDLEDTVTFGADHIGTLDGETLCLAKWKPCNDLETKVQTITHETPELVVYPNPSSGIFTFQWSVVSCKWSVEVYNVIGQRVFSSNYSLSTNHYSLNLSDKPSGIYLYRVTKDDSSLIGEGKLIIER